MAGKSYIKDSSGNWIRVKKMYVKSGGTTWTAIRKAYVKVSDSVSPYWKKVFDTASNRAFISGGDIPKIRLNTYRTNSSSAGTVNPVIEAPPVQYAGPRSNNVQGTTEAQPVEGYPDDNMGTTLFGYDGTWVSGNGTGITFAYDWFYNNDGDGNNISPFTNTSASYDDRVTNDSTRFSDKINGNMYGCSVYFRVRATNSAGLAQEVSTPVRVIKQPPNGFTLTMTTPAFAAVDTPKEVTIAGQNLWYNGPHQYESVLEWFSEANTISPLLNSSTLVKTQTLSSLTPTTEGDGTAINSTASYTPVGSDSGKYIYARLTLKNSGTTVSPGSPIVLIQNTTSPVGDVNEKTPQWGENIYVSTNGYIGLAGSSGNSTLNDTGTQGHVVSFLNKDLRQNSLKYWADSTKYIVDWSGRLYDATSTTVTYRYQAHFYPGQNYVDFYVINNAGGTSANAYLFNGQQQVAWGASKPAGSAYRITIKSGVAFQTIAYNPKSTATGFTSVTTNDEADDAATTLTLTQGISVPQISLNPEFQLVSGTANKVGATYRLTSGTWLNNPTSYKYYIYKNDINGTAIAELVGTTSTSFEYTFTAATTQTVSGLVVATNAGGDSANAYATSIGPFEFLAATSPTSVSASNNGSSDTVTISWSGAANATRYRIYWNSNGIIPGGGAATNFDEEKVVNGSTITSTSGSWAWGPSDPDKNSFVPSGRGGLYYMVSASSDGVNWSTYVVSTTAVGVVVPVPVNTSQPTLSPSGPYNVGDTLTFGVGSWSNTPTSYSLQLYRGTPGVITSETLVKDAGNVTSSTYVIQSSDYSLGRYYFRAFASATNSGGTSNGGTLTPGAESGPLNQPLSSPTPSSVTYSNSVFSVNFSGGSGPAYQIWYQVDNPTLFGTDAGTGDAQGTSSPVTKTLGGTEGSTYYWWVRSAKTTTSTGTGNVSAWSGPVSVTIPITPVIPTVTIAANSGVGQTTGTINWTSTNQARYSVDGTFAASGNPDTTTRSVSKTGLTASTTYTGTITVTSSTGNTATANYSLRTSDPAASYTLSYNANGGTGTMADTVGNGSVTLRANSFTRTNCTFAGWATSSGGSAVYSNQGAYTLSANATLYAVWTANANSATAPTVTFTGATGTSPNIVRSWSWTTGTVTGGTATGYEWQISSTGSTSGYGAWTFTTARTLSVNANTPRWLRVRKVYTDGLGVTQVGAFNNTGV